MASKDPFEVSLLRLDSEFHTLGGEALFCYRQHRKKTLIYTLITFSKIFEERTDPELAPIRMSESTERLSCKQCWTTQIFAVKCLRWPICGDNAVGGHRIQD